MMIIIHLIVYIMMNIFALYLIFTNDKDIFLVNKRYEEHEYSSNNGVVYEFNHTDGLFVSKIYDESFEYMSTEMLLNIIKDNFDTIKYINIYDTKKGLMMRNMEKNDMLKLDIGDGNQLRVKMKFDDMINDYTLFNAYPDMYKNNGLKERDVITNSSQTVHPIPSAPPPTLHLLKKMSNQIRNEIYYLCDLQYQCARMSRYGYKDIKNFIEFVNCKLNEYFTVDEQMRLKLYKFDENLLYNISNYNLPENISFDGINKNNLCKFFDEISYE
jgi:hypothetical protein